VSVGSDVNKPTYHAVGRVTLSVVNRYCSVLVSKALVKDMDFSD
jgi:hypothetical protein